MTCRKSGFHLLAHPAVRKLMLLTVRLMCMCFCVFLWSSFLIFSNFMLRTFSYCHSIGADQQLINLDPMAYFHQLGLVVPMSVCCRRLSVLVCPLPMQFFLRPSPPLSTVYSALTLRSHSNYRTQLSIKACPNT